ncbi:MAG: type VI secretion system tip protein VgrG, partial [Cytophagales bacterium]
MPIVPVSARTNPNLATFKILSEGTEIPPEIGVAMIAVTQAVNKLPAARIVLFDGDVASQDFEVSGGDFFIPGKKITVKAGYNNDEEVIFEGIIIRHGIEARGGASKLILELRDPAVKMTVGRKNKYFFDSKDSEIIEDLISGYGLGSEVEATTTTHKEMVQFYCSDWDFMLTRAELNSKLILVENGKVKMKSAEVSADAKLELEFGTNVVEIEAEMDARTQYASSKSKGWDMANQELLELESPDPGIDFQGDLSGQELAEVIGLEDFTLLHGGGFSGEELQNWADANMLKSRLSKIKGQIKIHGDNTIKPGDMVQLSGFGSRFNGKAFVSSVYHEVSPSQKWFTTLGLGLDHRFISSVFDDIVAVPAAGLVPAMKGLHIGKVTGLEDPDGENRVKILLPMIDASSEGTWARLATLDAGGEGVRGAVFYPEIGDEVIVGFINEDPRQPIILGSLFSSAN